MTIRHAHSMKLPLALVSALLGIIAMTACAAPVDFSAPGESSVVDPSVEQVEQVDQVDQEVTGTSSSALKKKKCVVVDADEWLFQTYEWSEYGGMICE